MSLTLHFTEEDWERHRLNWSAWWAGELERPLVVIEGIEPPAGLALPELPYVMSNYPFDMPAAQIVACHQAHLETRRFYGDAWPRWWMNFGPGVMAAFLGARVNIAPETVWFEPAQPVSIGEIHPRYDPDNVWWRRIQELTRTAVATWGRQVTVGHVGLGGNLDILASLRTTEGLLTDLYDAPDEVERVSREITRLWLRYYDELYAIIRPAGSGTTPWAPIWSPGRCYMLQSDFAYMISPRMFERFVLPDLAACCEALDHVLYHLDGKGQIVHLDMLLSLELLDGIQWIPGEAQPPPEKWLPLLRRIVDAGKRCQLYVSPEGALTIVSEIGGRGFAFAIERTMSEAQARDFLQVMEREDASNRRGTATGRGNGRQTVRARRAA